MNLLSKCALALRVCVLILCSFGFGTAGAVIPVQYQCADSWVAYNNPRFDACSAEETCRKGADYMRRPFLGFHYSQSGAQHCILNNPPEFWWVQFVPGRGGNAYCPPGAELSFTYNWGGWPSCHCPVGTTEQNGQCVGPAEIKLSGPTQALPVDAGGQALRIKATVTQGGSPKTASPVTVFIQPSAGGSISVLSAVTNASGEVLIDYTPPATMPGPAKADVLRADCTGCNKSANMAISVQGTPVLPATPQTCPASPGQETGYPILPASGTKVLRHTDWQDDAPHGLSLTRHFASRWSVGPAAGLGATWSHNHAHRVIGAGALAPASRMVAFGDGQVSPFINTGIVGYVDPNAGGIWQCAANTWCAPTQPVVDPNLYPPVWTATGSLDTMTDTPQGILVNRASDDSQWLFDRPSGLVLSHRQRNGWVYQFSYSNGRLTQVSNSFGRNLQFAYDAQGRLSSATAPDGTVIRYTFDSASRLIGAAYADNSSKSYLYENTSWPQAVTGVVDEQGNRFASFAYDAQGRAISSELADGADRVQVTYATGRSSVKDAFGVTRTYEYQPLRGRARGMDTTQASALGADGNAVASQSFNADSLLQSQTDFLGITTLFTWDAARRLKLAETRAASRPEAQTVQTEWHPTLRLPVLVTEAGRSTAYTYDALGNKLSEVVTDLATGQTRSQSWAYNAQGLVASTTDARGGSWTFAYDAQGNRTRQRNPLGHETQWQHDAAGRVTQQTEPNGLVTTFTWDARGRLTQANRGGEAAAYTYTPAGLLASATLPNGHAISYQYDAAQRLTAATDNRGNIV